MEFCWMRCWGKFHSTKTRPIFRPIVAECSIWGCCCCWRQSPCRIRRVQRKVMEIDTTENCEFYKIFRIFSNQLLIQISRSGLWRILNFFAAEFMSSISIHQKLTNDSSCSEDWNLVVAKRKENKKFKGKKRVKIANQDCLAVENPRGQQQEYQSAVATHKNVLCFLSLSFSHFQRWGDGSRIRWLSVRFNISILLVANPPPHHFHLHKTNSLTFFSLFFQAFQSFQVELIQ